MLKGKKKCSKIELRAVASILVSLSHATRNSCRLSENLLHLSEVIKACLKKKRENILDRNSILLHVELSFKYYFITTVEINNKM